MYHLGDRILMVASDRISTYDVVHPTPIADKARPEPACRPAGSGAPGTSWRNHFASATDGVPEAVRGRAMTVRRTRRRSPAPV
jgi:phosphoribosylaminoimidazole-succinocarboxamide synthase